MNVYKFDFAELKEYERRIIRTPLSNGKCILEMSNYEGLALWWLNNARFHMALRGMVNPNVQHNGPETTVRWALTKRIGGIIKQFDDVPLRIFQSAVKGMVCRGGQRQRRKTDGAVKVLITGEDGEWRTRDEERKSNEDQFFESLIKELKKRGGYEVVSVFPMRFPYIDPLKIYSSKLKFWEVRHTPLESYADSTTLRKVFGARLYFSKIWQQIYDDPILNEILTFHGQAINERIRGLLKSIFLDDFPVSASYHATTEACLNQEEPDILIVEEEYGGFERALVYNAHRKGVPSLAIQHGVIHERHVGYIYDETEISKNRDFRCPFVPIADKVALYGNRYLELLKMSSSFPQGVLITIGQPRYDQYLGAISPEQLEEARRDIGAESDDIVILWTNAWHGLPREDNEKIAHDVTQELEKFDHAYLIVKPHPSDRPDHLAVIEKALKNSKIKSKLMSPKSNTPRLIRASNLVIVWDSTTGLEALAMGKSIINLNLSGFPDHFNFVTDGVANGVYDAKELIMALQRSLAISSDQLAARERYLNNYLYKPDGHATERLVDLIEQMLNATSKREEVRVLKGS